MDEVAPGILRVTQPLPLGIDHVHCHLLAGDDGWTLVDAGLALPQAEEWWRGVLGELDGPLRRVVVTHLHPDHLGGAGLVAGLAGVPVHQAPLDRAQSLRLWRDDGYLDAVDRWFERHGLPPAELAQARAETEWVRTAIAMPGETVPLAPGEAIAGWRALALPGHADGQIGLRRGGTLLAGDALLATISPVVGAYPEADPDPLARFATSLLRIREIAPRLVLSGHGPPIADAAARVEELLAHHRERLAAAAGALAGRAATAYEVSLALWPGELPATLRRMAVAEALAHLERLVAGGAAARERDDAGRRVAYTAADAGGRHST